MVQFCCVVGCGHRSNRDCKRFYRLPIIPKTCKNAVKIELLLQRRKQWLDNIDRIDLKDGDSNYSPGYIRVCADHFHTGKPSKLTEVDHPDWAPTVKMGQGLPRIKGTREKRAMFGISLSKKRAKTNKRQKPVTVVDNEETERRRKLALYTEELQQKNSYYRHVKKKKEATQKKTTQQKLRVAKKTFMKRKAVMQIKMSEQNMSEPKGSRAISSKMANKTSEASTDGESSLTPNHILIHKIGADCIIPNEAVQFSDGNGYRSFTSNTNAVIELFDEISNSSFEDSSENECTSVRTSVPIADNECQIIHEIMNEHLSSLKAEFKEEPMDETMDEQLSLVKSEIKEEPMF